MKGRASRRRWRAFFLGSAVLTLTAVSQLGAAQEREVTITGREIVERLTRIEEGQKRLEAQLTQRIDGVESRLGQRIDGVESTLGQRIDGVESRLGQRIDGVESRLGQRIDAINQRIDDLRQLLLWGFGLTFTGMFALVGFVIWDRRTAIAPVIRQVAELEDEHKKFKEAMRELSKESQGSPKP